MSKIGSDIKIYAAHINYDLSYAAEVAGDLKEDRFNEIFGDGTYWKFEDPDDQSDYIEKCLDSDPSLQYQILDAPDRIEVPNRDPYVVDGKIDYDAVLDYISDTTGLLVENFMVERGA